MFDIGKKPFELKTAPQIQLGYIEDVIEARSMQFFAFLNNSSAGPFTARQLIALPGFGPAIQVWPEGWKGWVPAEKVPDLASLLAGQGIAPVEHKDCPFCAEPIRATAIKCRYCGSFLTEEAIAGFAEDLARHLTVVEPVLSEPANEFSTRRLATVVLADFCVEGSAGKPTTTELQRDLHNAIFSDLSSAAGSYGGEITAFSDNRLTAVWGRRKTREEDAIRACAAGIAMLQRVSSRASRLGITLHFRAGIHTGEFEANDANIAGAAVDQADQLRSAAAHGTIRASEDTNQRLGQRFQVEKIDNGGGYRIVAARALSKSENRRVLDKFVARQEESAQIGRALHALATNSTRPTGILITGHGGTGKSRLCAHCIAHFKSSSRVLFGQGVPSESPVLGGIVASWLRDLIGGASDAALFDYFNRHPDQKSYSGDIGLILSTGDKPESSRSSPSSGQRLDRNLARFFVKASMEQPLILSAADMQWVDGLSVEVCLSLAEAARMGAGRLILVLDGRPGDVIERLSTAPGFEKIELGPLPAERIFGVLNELIEGTLPDTWVETLLSRTGGVMLHLSQLLDALAEMNVLERASDADRWRLTRPDEELPLPSSLSDLIWLRVDRLTENARRTLLAASVCGIRFPGEMLLKALDIENEVLLEMIPELSRNDFLHESDGEIFFGHGSIRECARRMLMKSERRRIAERILDAYGRRIWWSECRDLAIELHNDAERHADLRRHLVQESHRLLKAWRLPDAKAALNMAARSEWGDDFDSHLDRHGYVSALARLSENENDYVTAVGWNEQALEIARGIDQPQSMAINLGALARIAEKVKEWDRAIAYNKEALSINRRLANSRGISIHLHALGKIAQKRENWDEAIVYYEEALTLGEDVIQDRRGYAIVLSSVGRALIKKREWKKAQPYFERAIAMGNWIREDPRGQSIILNSLSNISENEGDFERAVACARQALDITRSLNDQNGVNICLNILARIAETIGDIDGAIVISRRSAAFAEDCGNQRGAEFANRRLEKLASSSRNPSLPVDIVSALFDAVTSLDSPPPKLKDIQPLKWFPPKI